MKIVIGIFISFLPLNSQAVDMAPSEALYVTKEITEKNVFTRAIEGPAADRMGTVYVVNFQKDGTIGVLEKNKNPALWLELPNHGISSSIRFNPNGEMLVADRRNHQILKINLSTKDVSVLVKNEKLNQPNDFTVSQNGDLFLSDPSWNPKKEGGIWLVENQAIRPLAKNLKAVNGIDLSPNEDKLYFTESISGSLWEFVIKNKELINKKKIHQFKKNTVDGLRVDTKGQLYIARIGEGKVDCLSAQGQILRSIPLKGRDPTNLAFGGTDGKNIYVTLRDTGTVETFRVPYPGREWQIQRKQTTQGQDKSDLKNSGL